MVNFETETILLIEDDSADIELASHIIKEKIPNAHLRVARNGNEALNFFFDENNLFNGADIHNLRVIILDLHMPVTDGFEVLKRLKANSNTKNIPVVVLTSSQEARDIERCYALGVNSYSVKPIDAERFEHIIENIGRYWLTINETSAIHTQLMNFLVAGIYIFHMF